jgi:DNA-binding NtrC family response regulator
MAKTVLVVDDDPTQRRIAQAVLEREGYIVVHAEGGGQAIDRLTKGAGADVVLLDMVMPGMSGMEALAEIRTAGVTTPVIVLTANGGVDAVVKAMQAGAQDFFVKPVSAERLLVGVRNALQLTQLTAEVGRLKKHHGGRTSFDDLVGNSPPMRLVKSLGARAAKSGIPVLITGESGVGKEVIARALHGASDRAGKPFVAVNCGALPANLVESILFGHEKGSFTGATDKHLGKFAEASGGTLFLDEIGDVPLSMQVKLLRLIESGTYRRVGGVETLQADFRLVAATHKPLEQMVAQGLFRQDLYYRIAAFPIVLPPLRERREDIPMLVDSFLQRARGFKARIQVSPEALARLQAHSWPGNIRELRNVLERARLFADDGVIRPKDLPAGLGVPVAAAVTGGGVGTGPQLPAAYPGPATAGPAADSARPPFGRPTRELDDSALRAWISQFSGTRREMASALGWSERTLYRRLKALAGG